MFGQFTITCNSSFRESDVFWPPEVLHLLVYVCMCVYSCTSECVCFKNWVSECVDSFTLGLVLSTLWLGIVLGKRHFILVLSQSLCFGLSASLDQSDLIIFHLPGSCAHYITESSPLEFPKPSFLFTQVYDFLILHSWSFRQSKPVGHMLVFPTSQRRKYTSRWAVVRLPQKDVAESRFGPSLLAHPAMVHLAAWQCRDLWIPVADKAKRMCWWGSHQLGVRCCEVHDALCSAALPVSSECRM